MSRVTSQLPISLDGYVAGPRRSREPVDDVVASPTVTHLKHLVRR